MSKQRWTRGPAIALVGLVAVLAIGCSSSAEPQMPDGIDVGTLPPIRTGASGQDPTGDISDAADEVSGTLTEPAGIDLVSVTADVSDTTLTVTYTSAGP